MEELQTSFIGCSCGSEIVRVDKDEQDGMTYISIYKFGYNRDLPTLWSKLKYCWHILKTGKIYGDQVVLYKEESDTLKNML